MRHLLPALFCATALPLCAQFGEQRIIEGTETEGAFIVLSADIDLDGDLDVVSGSMEDDRIAWFENSEGGLFGSPRVIVDLLPRLEWLDLADVDGDGDTDVLFTTWQDQFVSWCPNDGQGNFLPPIVIGFIDGYPTHVCTGDLDGDGILDILVMEFGDLYCFPGEGAGAFGDLRVIDLGAAYGQRDIHCADIDGDGDTDILCAMEHRGIQKLVNDGSGNFSLPVQLNSVNESLRSVFTTDLNGDGVLDAYGSAFSAGEYLVWYPGLGGGEFAPHVNCQGPGGDAVAAADIDGDGDMDMSMIDTETGALYWCANDGTGVFGEPHLITTTAHWAMYVHACDLDGDGDQDLLTASHADDKIAWYENGGAGDFGPQTMITEAASYALEVKSADMDGDGDLDVLSASFSDNKLAWYPNDGFGGFGPVHRVTMEANHPGALCAGDLDGDGDTDLVLGTRDNALFLYENIGQGVFNAPVPIVDEIGIPEELDVADFDGDGRLDILVSSGAPAVFWLRNNSDGTFEMRYLSTGVSSGSVQAKDMDLDGDIDAVFIVNGQVRWRANDGIGLFGPVQTVVSGTPACRDHFAADMEGDGDVDVLVVRGDEVVLFLNEASIFTPLTIDPFIDRGVRVRPVDADRDGDLDVIAASFDGDELRYYEQTEPGVFGPAQVLTTEVEKPQWIALADLDNDGDEDLLSASSGDNKIAWYENQYHITGIESSTRMGSRLAPNPMAFSVQLVVDHVISTADLIHLLDASGRRVRSFSGNGSRSIHIERGDLASGLYWIELHSHGRSVQSHALIIE